MIASMRFRLAGVCRILCVILAGVLLASCGFNTIPTLQERAKAGWSYLGHGLRADINILSATNLYIDNLFGLWVSHLAPSA